MRMEALASSPSTTPMWVFFSFLIIRSSFIPVWVVHNDYHNQENNQEDYHPDMEKEEGRRILNGELSEGRPRN